MTMTQYEATRSVSEERRLNAESSIPWPFIECL
jgi:hypothetical protein